jgi:NADPH-dependent 2,4-dienoyl-CoA reductase/sulfur reductase-like enzyme
MSSKHGQQLPYVIIGAGAAGMSAVQGIRELDPDVPIVVISDEGHSFYSKPGLAYWLLGQIPEEQLYPQLPVSDETAGATYLNLRVLAIDPVSQIVQLEDGRGIEYGKLLLVTGAQAIRPKIEGIELDGVVTLDTLSDARRILKLARRARRAVVVGGGITALELAEGLCARGVETHYLLRKDRYWSNVLDEPESQLVEACLKEEGVRIHYRSEIDRIEGKKGRVAGVNLSSGEHIACQMVGVAIGIRPRTHLAVAAGLEVDRGVIVDERLKTSVEGIYAAGDVAQVWDPETGSHVLDSLWWIAREQGRVAGRNMAGADEVYQRKTPFNVTRIGGITTTLIGRLGQGEKDEDLVAIARGDSETWRTCADVFAVEKDTAHDRVRLLVGDQQILGALVMGDQTLSRPLQHLIAEEVDIRSIRGELMSQPAQLVSLIERLWAETQASVNAR